MQTILITGGTGALGTALVRRFYDAYQLIVFSRDEHKHDVLKKTHPKIKSFIGDIRDYDRVKQVMEFADIVIHAGAMKVVPECEYHPTEAVKTNVIGSFNVLRAFEQSNAETLIGISTDKACHCINLYGATKYAMEKMYVNSTSGKHISCLRYGNVVGSTGSVIPLWIDAIHANEPIKLTVPTMTRFLISMDCAVDLVEFAINRKDSREIIIPNLKSVRMRNLAEGLIRYAASKGIKTKSKIEITGMRPGEKQHEKLVNEDELYRTIDIGTHYIIKPDAQDDCIAKEYTSFGCVMPDNELDLFLQRIL